MFKASGGFYNIRALQRTLNHGHMTRRKKKNAMNAEPMESSPILDILSSGAIFLVFLQSNGVDSGRLERL